MNNNDLLAYSAFGACSGSKPNSNPLLDVVTCLGVVVSRIWRRTSTTPFRPYDGHSVPNTDTRPEWEINRSRFVSVPCGR